MIRNRFGLSLLASGNEDIAQKQMKSGTQILESIRCDQVTPEGRIALYNLQTSCHHTLLRIHLPQPFLSCVCWLVAIRSLENFVKA